MWEETVLEPEDLVRLDVLYETNTDIPASLIKQADITRAIAYAKGQDEGYAQRKAEELPYYNEELDRGYALAVKQCWEVVIPREVKEAVRLERERMINWIYDHSLQINYGQCWTHGEGRFIPENNMQSLKEGK